MYLTKWIPPIAAVALVGLGMAPRSTASVAAPEPAEAAVEVPIVVTEAPRPQNVPFGLGERAEYAVRLGRLGTVGQGTMHISAIETVDRRSTYRTRMQISGGIPLARVHDVFESWIDVNGLFSRRYHQDQREVNFERQRQFDFFPERRAYRRTTPARRVRCRPTGRSTKSLSSTTPGRFRCGSAKRTR